MGKRKGDQPNPQAQDQAGSEPDTLAPPTETTAAAPPDVAKIEAPELAPPQPEPEPVVAIAPAATPDAPPIAAALDPPKPEAQIAEPMMARSDEIHPVDLRPDEAIAPVAALGSSSWRSSAAWTNSWAKARRLAPLAATIAIAATLGAMAGSFATAGLGNQPTAEPVGQTADARAVKDSIARLHAEIAALKTSLDTSAKSAGAQFIKLGDRFDRFEKAQAEPVAKLAKLTDAVDRIERRAPATSASAAHDITGSVAALALAPQAATAEPARPAGPPVLEGWYVRSVYNGAALIQGRLGGVMEVEPGDNLPGLGRIETIRRQDGRWVVVTSKGLIVAR